MRTYHLVIAGLLIGLSIVAGTAGCTASPTTVKPAKIRLGTLPQADSLPLWVAERDGLFKKAGLDVAIYEFPSTQDRDKALVDGSLDGEQADLIVPASARSGGVPVRVVTIMYGVTPQDGRSGLVVAPGSKIKSLRQLAGVPVATSIGGLPEYVLDNLMSRAGVPASDVKTVEIKKIPVRLGLLLNRQVEAAVLAEPFLSLAILKGARLIADDTSGENLTESTMLFRKDYLDRPEGAAAVKKLLGVWDDAVARVNADPDAYRALLGEKASIPEPLAKTFKVGRYETHQLPRKADVERLLEWLRKKRLLAKPVTYSDLVWAPPGQ